VVLLVAQGLLPVAMVHLTRVVVDRLATATATEMTPGSVWHVMSPAIVLALVYLLSELMRALTRLVRTAQADLVRDDVSGLVHRHTMHADLAEFETPEFHDRLHRARRDSHEGPTALVQNLGSLVQYSITLVAMGVVLVSFGWWVPAVLLASTLPALAVVARHALTHHRWTLRSTPDTRRSWYYDWILSTRETAAELRLFDLGPRFADLYQSIRGRLRRELFTLTRAEALAEAAAGAFALAVTGSVVVWMIFRTVEGSASLGGLAMFLQAFTQGQALMRSLLETVGQTWSNILFLENLFGFLDVEPSVVDAPRTLQPQGARPPAIRFRSISFTYPGSATPVFRDFDLEIAGGTTAALLGVNGAGKSTLFKLVCRFYDPDEGRVEIGGTDIRRLKIADVRRLVSALFQEPVHYSETVAENISVAGLDEGDDPTVFDTAVRLSGAGTTIEKLPQGPHTVLGTWFSGGAELSVGEWQRLALARALNRKSPILLLDEPTAAMDSWTEAEWGDRLKEMADGRTVLVITHRLTTAMHADAIHIVDNGRIIESGSHHELLERDGPYRQAWEGQFGRNS